MVDHHPLIGFDLVFGRWGSGEAPDAADRKWTDGKPCIFFPDVVTRQSLLAFHYGAVGWC
jgi:hypothetical protein